MPDAEGKLTDIDKDVALAWLRTHWANPNCPFHGATNWSLGDLVIQGLAYTGGGLTIGGPVYPFLVITCSVCGYTVLVNAIAVGVVKPQAVPPSASATGG